MLRIGISIASRYDVEDHRQGAQWILERAQAAAEAGLDSLFVGDHHVTPAPYYQNTPMLSRALAHWHQAPAGALYLLPFRHPVLLAEEIATMATLMPTRFIMQCGLGYGEREFAAFGINAKHRPSRFEECLQIMQRLWAGERVSHQGRWQIKDAQISPLPPEPIEVWLAGSAEAALDRAARLGLGWLAAPGLIPSQAKASLDYYLAACEKHGQTPGAKAIRRDIYIGQDAAEAQAIGGKIVAAGYRGFDPEACIVGDAEQVAQAFQNLADLGFSDIIIRNLVAHQSQALASIARLAAVKALLD